MTSILDEIEALFSWNPPALKPVTLTGKKPSTKSCSPAFYDKHFSDPLVLLCVKRLPSLVQDLAANVDRALRAASESLPPVDGFYTTKDTERAVRNINKNVKDEKGVANFYDKTTGMFCTPLASTLALHPKASTSNWRSLLEWTQSVSSSGYAIMDGELGIMAAASDAEDAEHEMIVETMESETRRVFDEIRNSRSPFATWEMKSPFAGPLEAMLAVPNLGNFSWTSCTYPEWPTDEKHINVRKKIEDIKVGVDALAPPWNLNDAPPDIHVEPLSAPFIEGSSGSQLRPVKQRITQSTAASTSTSSMAPAPQLASAPMLAAKQFVPLGEASSGTSRQLRTRVTRSTAASTSTSMLPPPIIPAKNKGKGREEEEATPRNKKPKHKHKEGDDGEAYKNRHDLTAKSLVQQAWAQAVRVDGTIIVLHSGNHELVCVRHRKTQTLYVSDLIEPPTFKDPGYGKLQVGIYVAAIQDRMDRTKQHLQLSQPKSPYDSGDDPAGGDNDKGDRGSGSGYKSDQESSKGRTQGGDHSNPGSSVRKSGQFQGRAGIKVPGVDELVAIEKTIQAASKRDMLLLYIQYGVYDSPIPASFIRSAPPIMAKAKFPASPLSPRAIRTYTLYECLSIVLTSEIGRGATGVVHRGTLKLQNGDGSVPLDVVVKLAFDSQQRGMLKTEYETYSRLRSKGVFRGLTTTLGFFDDTEDSSCALVMLYAGDSLVDKPECVLSVSECRLALSTLASIHRAGILHGDIRRENILVSSSGVTIIDFSHSERCDDQETMDKEYAQLCFFLGFE